MDKREQELMTFRQVLDQTGEMLRDVAAVVARYYFTLRESGVPEALAGVLAAEVQASIIDLILAPKPPEPRP